MHSDLLSRSVHESLQRTPQAKSGNLPAHVIEYIPDMVARCAHIRNWRHLDARSRNFYDVTRAFSDAENEVSSRRLAAIMYSQIGDQLLVMLSFAPEYLFHREWNRAAMTVRFAASLASRSYLQACSIHPDTPPSWEFLGQHFPTAQSALHSVFRDEFRHRFRSVEGDISAIANLPLE